MKKAERSQWYEAHSKEILADAEVLPWRAMRKRWGIPVGTLAGMKARVQKLAAPPAAHPAEVSGPKSPGWDDKRRPEKIQWYKDHTGEILADYDELSFNKTLDIWGMPPTTLSGMLQRNKRGKQIKRRHEAREGLIAFRKKLEDLATTLQDTIARVEVLEARKVIETDGEEMVIIVKPGGGRVR